MITKIKKLFWRGELVSIELKFPGPLQIPTARNKCEYYYSHKILIVNLMTYAYIFLLFPLFNILSRGTTSFKCLCSIAKSEKIETKENFLTSLYFIY